MMTKSRKDLLDRVKCNLEFIQPHCAKGGPYEVTQLLSSFLLTLHLNWDDLDGRWDNFSQRGVQWPKIEQEGLQQPKQAIRNMRHALAHGLLAFEEGSNGDIVAVHLWTCSDRKTVDWAATITVEEMALMLKCFTTLATLEVGEMKLPKKVGHSCC